MTRDDRESLERRVAAVERALGDDDPRATNSGQQPKRSGDDLAIRVDEVCEQVDELIDRIDELDAGLQAVRGFLGGVDAVNESVERRANAAIAAVDRLEERIGKPPEPLGSEDPTDHLDSDELTDTAVSELPDTRASETDDGAGETATASLRDRLRSLR